MSAVRGQDVGVRADAEASDCSGSRGVHDVAFGGVRVEEDRLGKHVVETLLRDDEGHRCARVVVVDAAGRVEGEDPATAAEGTSGDFYDLGVDRIEVNDEVEDLTSAERGECARSGGDT